MRIADAPASVPTGRTIGTIDDAVTIPLELVSELGGRRARVLARARIAYVTAADGRHDEPEGFPVANDYFAGGAVRELAGARCIGLTIGYSIDIATAPSRLTR